SRVGTNGVRALTPTGMNEIGSLVNVAFPNPVYYFPSEPSLGPVAQEYTRRLLAIGVADPTANLISPTAIKQQPYLDQLINDRVSSIVRGSKLLSELNNL